jgi:hypothetical protein
MTSILTKLKTLFSQRKSTGHQPDLEQDASHASLTQTPDKETVQNLNTDILKNLMSALEHTHEGMYNCDETFALLDEYVELILDNEEEAASLMPYVRRHLEMCPDCHEAYEVLRRILGSETTSAELPH